MRRWLAGTCLPVLWWQSAVSSTTHHSSLIQIDQFSYRCHCMIHSKRHQHKPTSKCIIQSALHSFVAWPICVKQRFCLSCCCCSFSLDGFQFLFSFVLCLFFSSSFDSFSRHRWPIDFLRAYAHFLLAHLQLYFRLNYLS